MKSDKKRLRRYFWEVSLNLAKVYLHEGKINQAINIYRKIIPSVPEEMHLQ